MTPIERLRRFANYIPRDYPKRKEVMLALLDQLKQERRELVEFVKLIASIEDTTTEKYVDITNHVGARLTELFKFRQWAIRWLINHGEQEEMAADIDGLCSAVTDEQIRCVNLKQERQELVELLGDWVRCYKWWQNEKNCMEFHTNAMEELFNVLSEFGIPAEQWLAEHGELEGENLG